MEKESRRKILQLGKIISFNLVPIVGVLFLGWGIFELAFTYFLETGVVFIVFFIDQYFINKVSRYPFPYAVVQLIFMIIPFAGLIFGWTILTFSMTQPNYGKNSAMIEKLNDHLGEFDFWWILFAFLVFEAVNYIVKNLDGRKHKSSSVWYQLKKILMVHGFVIITTFIYGILPHNTLTGLILIMGLKIVLDYVVESDVIMGRFDSALERFSTYGLKEDGTAYKDDEIPPRRKSRKK